MVVPVGTSDMRPICGTAARDTLPVRDTFRTVGMVARGKIVGDAAAVRAVTFCVAVRGTVTGAVAVRVTVVAFVPRPVVSTVRVAVAVGAVRVLAATRAVAAAMQSAAIKPHTKKMKTFLIIL